MVKSLNKKNFKIITTVIFILMVVINMLANIIPINGYTTGEVSDIYKNLFAPIGFTFSIWGLIYLLLFIYIIYQYKNVNDIFDKVNYYFIISSISNIFWILSWHYKKIGLSMIFIIIIFYSLSKISEIYNNGNLTQKEQLYFKIPFSIYYGWITVAVVANFVTFLSSLNFNMINQLITFLFLVLGFIIAMVILNREKNIPYGLTVIWGYLGIFFKHISKNGFNGEYKIVIITTLIIILLLLFKLIKRE